MALFNNWPYVDLSKLNLNWIITQMKNMGESIKALDLKIEAIKDLIPDIPDIPEPAPPFEVKDVYNAYNTSAWLQEHVEEIGTVGLPSQHTVCSAEYNSNYLYVAHHKSDDDPMYISKYTYPELELVIRATIGSGMHGNGLGFDQTRSLLILSNGYNDQLTNSHTIYLINPNTLAVVKRIDYAPFGNVSLSTFDISPDGESAAALLTGSGKILEYDINPDTLVASAVRIHALPEVGDGVLQDGTLTDTFYYQLCSNSSIPRYTQNQIIIYSFRTGYFKTLFLDHDDYAELEGISRINTPSYAGLVLVDVNGKVYFGSTRNAIIASGRLTKKDNVCSGKPQYEVVNPMQLRKQSGTVDMDITSDNYDITATLFLRTPSFDLKKYSLRELQMNQDAWKAHAGWYYAPLCFGDRDYLTSTISTMHGNLLIRYGYYENIGGIQLQRIYYRSFDGTVEQSAQYDGTDDTGIIAVVKAFIDDNHNELQPEINIYPEIWNCSDYARTGDIWNINMS